LFKEINAIGRADFFRVYHQDVPVSSPAPQSGDAQRPLMPEANNMFARLEHAAVNQVATSTNERGGPLAQERLCKYR
jgi:hypothetical protein